MEFKKAKQEVEGGRRADFSRFNALVERYSPVAAAFAVSLAMSCGGGPSSAGGSTSDSGAASSCKYPTGSPDLATFHLNDIKETSKVYVSFNGITASGNGNSASFRISDGSSNTQMISLSEGDEQSVLGVSLQLCGMTSAPCSQDQTNATCTASLGSSLGWQ